MAITDRQNIKYEELAMRKFSLLVEWNYRGEPSEQFEHCIIAPATPEDEEHDGENYITGKGVDGFKFSIYDSLAEAILSAHFNPFSIEYNELTDEELKQKDELLSHYTWSYKHWLQKKSE